jgi:hypothetical protein
MTPNSENAHQPMIGSLENDQDQDNDDDEEEEDEPDGLYDGGRR